MIFGGREEKDTDQKDKKLYFYLRSWYLVVKRKRTLTKRKDTIFLSSFLKFGCREEKDMDKKEETFTSIFVFGCREELGTDKILRKKPLFLSSFLICGCREEKDTDKKEETFNFIFVLDCWLRGVWYALCDGIHRQNRKTNKQKQTKKQQQLILNSWPQMPAVDEHCRFSEEYGRVKAHFLRVYL